MYGLILLLHIFGAVIWAGGHIVLSVVVLPEVLREKAPEKLLAFESKFERIGMPALIVQIITGLLLAKNLLPSFSQWLDFSNPITHVVAAKLLLLALTLALAADAKLRVLPNFSAARLNDMAWHIIPVTLLSVLLIVAGVSFRTGWLY